MGNGSTHGRAASKAEREKGALAVYKDLDWLSEGRRLAFATKSTTTERDSGIVQRHEKGAFLESVQRDVQLLQECELIDYSLLVGVHERDASKTYWRIERTPGLVVLDNADSIMYLCIIDILTPCAAWAPCVILRACALGAESAFCSMSPTPVTGMAVESGQRRS